MRVGLPHAVLYCAPKHAGAHEGLLYGFMHQSKQGHTKVSCMDLVTYHLQCVCAENFYLVLIQYDA